MKVTAEKNEKVANMVFATVYPLYWNRLEKHEEQGGVSSGNRMVNRI